ncbi:MAG: hypothetical protein HGN29_13475 [Asgard group archaeon]|nr:hypothetical protein [Asgard group archaeon]
MSPQTTCILSDKSTPIEGLTEFTELSVEMVVILDQLCVVAIHCLCRIT